MPLMTPLPLAICTPPNAHIFNPHTGKWPSPHQAIRPLLPSYYHPLPSPIGPATAAALTNTRAHAHLDHHLHSRFAYPLQGHPPCRHMHQLPPPPLLGLPSGMTTPPSQLQTYPLAAQQQHWPWELRGTGKANPRTRPCREVRLLLLRRVGLHSHPGTMICADLFFFFFFFFKSEPFEWVNQRSRAFAPNLGLGPPKGVSIDRLSGVGASCGGLSSALGGR